MSDTPPVVPDQLREQAERVPDLEAAKAQAEADADLLRLDAAGLRAGIDLSTREGRAWASTYEGDWESVDEMQSDYRKMFGQEQAAPAQAETPASPGDLPHAEPTPISNAPSFQTGMTADRRGVSEGGAIPPSQPVPNDPWKAGYEALYQGRQDGRPEANNRAEVLNRVIDAAVDGDDRVLWSHDHRDKWIEETGANYHR